jgi:ribosome biogenesis GTPase A
MINWFPGHMNTAKREIAKAMPKVDLVIEVLDARLPYSSENPLVADLRGTTPCIQILNKKDLADPDVTEQWLAQLESKEGVLALAHQQGEPRLNQRLLDRVGQLATARTGQPVSAMILGIPNVGKSTLINALSGRAIAKTGNKPAVTKSHQRVNVGKGLVLWDTPGFLWPRLSPAVCGYRLAVSGAISDRIVDAEEIAHFALTFLLERYPERLVDTYGLEIDEGEADPLEPLGQCRNHLRKGGVVDRERTAMALLRDLRSGALGRISLETPADWRRR